LSRAAATEPPGPEATAPAGAGERYGPNTAEVTAFIESVGRLSPSKWKKVIAARGPAARVTRDGSGQPAEIVRAMLGGAPNGAATLPEPMSNVATDMAAMLAKRSDAEAVAAWQAASALVRRRQLSALTFAAHYAPFASVIPPLQADGLPPIVERFANALKWMSAPQWESLSRPWSLDRESSGSLLQAALKSRARESEEAVAIAAIAVTQVGPEARGLAKGGPGHRFANPIDLGLVKPGDLSLGLVCTFNQIPSLLYRNKVLISGHNEPPSKIFDFRFLIADLEYSIENLKSEI